MRFRRTGRTAGAAHAQLGRCRGGAASIVRRAAPRGRGPWPRAAGRRSPGPGARFRGGFAAAGAWRPRPCGLECGL